MTEPLRVVSTETELKRLLATTIKEEEKEDASLRHGIISTNRLRKRIVVDIIQPAYIDDIKDSIKGRYNCRKVSMVLFIASVILSSVATILTFLSTYFGHYITLIAGSCGVCSSIVLYCSSVAKSESKRMSIQVNETLRQLKIEGVPVDDDDDIKR